MLNLDTHILVHALAGNLSAREQAVLSRERWGISAIVLWEIAKLSQLGRISLDIGSAEFSQVCSSIHLWPLDLEICRAMRKLDFRGDPADEIIAATSLVHRAALVTRDRRILGSTVVPLA
ncbi:MAG: PIN domain-containing protein [Acidobacteria bacterium]|nr:PIN domain-containing protein [Acidobacteriota bacterium]